ncbi:MAG: peptidase C39 [Firmicutes bacterium]|nr:peptidase C39 [Bacillota bacterium]
MLLKVPLILQNPELPRGCEVTSLAMLLQYAGVPADKMTLAHEIRKDPSPYRVNDGKIYFGNPHAGFVGNMYTLKEPGYGVYHGPICELLEKYLPGRTIDLTGCALEEVLLFISEGVPVWVVANATFAPLPPAEFQVWHTPQGSVKITYREHAVLLTGYDAENVYFNDPRFDTKNRQASRQEFTAAWEQMGSQAVTYLPY